MAEWKKVVVSGSSAELSNLNVDSAVTASFFKGDGSALTNISAGSIDHDSLSGFVANEHIDHTSVTITAGAGLTGGGDISATRTLNVVGGDGITANADDIAVDATVLRTTGGGVLSGSAQVVAALSNQDVNLGTGDLIATDIQFTNLKINGNNGTPTTFVTSSEDGATLSFGDHGNNDDITRIKLRVMIMIL